jgi:hypothetical protein
MVAPHYIYIWYMESRHVRLTLPKLISISSPVQRSKTSDLMRYAEVLFTSPMVDTIEIIVG